MVRGKPHLLSGMLTHPFGVGADYTLSCLKVASLSLTTDSHLVSEPSPLPCHSGFRSLAADCPILKIFTLPSVFLQSLIDLSYQSLVLEAPEISSVSKVSVKNCSARSL